jgi:hypothetical protein
MPQAQADWGYRRIRARGSFRTLQTPTPSVTNAGMESTMAFPSVADCLASRGTERDLLQDFDQCLREAFGLTRLKACSFDLDDRAFAMACVTTMMSVVAGLALAASEDPADVEANSFSMMALDALAWAKFNHHACPNWRQ